MPTILFNNPYHNLASLPAQPVSSVVGPNVLYNAYNETGNLNLGYNFVDFGNKHEQNKLMQDAHRNAYYMDPQQYESMDPSNILPQLMPLYYIEKPNFSYLNNPAPVNPNYDMRSQFTYINPMLTVNEGYPTVNPILIGLANSKLTFGPTSFN